MKIKTLFNDHMNRGKQEMKKEKINKKYNKEKLM
jgi:hypothetical protein